MVCGGLMNLKQSIRNSQLTQLMKASPAIKSIASQKINGVGFISGLAEDWIGWIRVRVTSNTSPRLTDSLKGGFGLLFLMAVDHCGSLMKPNSHASFRSLIDHNQSRRF